MRRLGRRALVGVAALLLPSLAGAQEKPAAVTAVKPAPPPITIKSHWPGEQRRPFDWFRPLDYFAQSAMPSLVVHESMPGGVMVASSSNPNSGEAVIVAVSAEAQQTPTPIFYQGADGKLYTTPQEAGMGSSVPLIGSGNATGGPGHAGMGGQVAPGGGDEQQDNGTNPAQNSRTAIIVNEFYHLDGGNEINTVYVRLKFPILEKRGSLLIEVPYKWYDIVDPLEGEVGGLGDVKLQLSYNACVSDDRQWTFITFLEMFIPSADNILLQFIADANQFTAVDVGTGKYILGPGVGVVYAPAPNFIIAPLYFYEASVAGDGDRPDIRRGKLRVFMMYAWPSGLYTLPELNWVQNYKNWNNDVYFAPEVGYSVKGSTFYIKPGFGIAPDTNDREWGFEFGLRVQF